MLKEKFVILCTEKSYGNLQKFMRTMKITNTKLVMLL